MDLAQLTQIRTQLLEQYAQANSDLAELKARKTALRCRASAILEDVRQLSAQLQKLQHSEIQKGATNAYESGD